MTAQFSTRVAREAKPARLPKQGDHRAWLAYWAHELATSVANCVPECPAPPGPWDMDQEHAVRSARMIHYHGSKVLGWKRKDVC